MKFDRLPGIRFYARPERRLAAMCHRSPGRGGVAGSFIDSIFMCLLYRYSKISNLLDESWTTPSGRNSST